MDASTNPPVIGTGSGAGPAGSAATTSYNATPYRPDSGATPGGMIIGAAAALVAGAALGFGASFVSQWFYLILLFPVFIGWSLGLLVGRALKAGKVRNVIAAGVVGLVGGVVAMGSMHYFDSVRFIDELQAEIAAEWGVDQSDVAAQWTEIVDEVGEADNGAKLPVDMETHIEFMAAEGVQITGRPGSTSEGLNIGYVGSYIYWILEVLVVAGISVFVTRGVISFPFCARSNEWKSAEMLGKFHANGRRISAALHRGDLVDFAAALADRSAGRGVLLLTVYTSPQFPDSEPIDVKLETETLKKKGETSTDTIAFITLEAGALEPLRAAAVQALAVERSPADGAPTA